MREWFNLAKSSICAGLLIGCAGFAYTMTGGIIGSFLFCFGLFGVLYGNWSLYTGYAGSYEWRDKTDWVRLFFILAGNWVGVMTLALVASTSSDANIAKYNEVVSNIIADRTSTEWWKLFVRAIATGLIMEIAVRYGREAKYMTVLLGVPVFIVCGLPHCVADIYYYGIDWLTAEGSAMSYLVPWLAAIAGNLVGCNIPRLLSSK